MSDISHKIDASIANMLTTAWGGRLPTWDEFKAAKNAHRVSTNKGIANKAIHLQGIPRAQMIMFGVITPWAMFIVPIACVILCLLQVISAWWIAGGLLIGWYLYKVTLQGACDAACDGAEAHEALYNLLVARGAFFFKPEGSELQSGRS